MWAQAAGRCAVVGANTLRAQERMHGACKARVCKTTDHAADVRSTTCTVQVLNYEYQYLYGASRGVACGGHGVGYVPPKALGGGGGH